MEVLGPAEPVVPNDQIIAQGDKFLTEMIKASLDSEYDFQRQILINEAKRRWLFVKGQHFGVPGFVGNGYGGDTVDFVGYDFFGGGNSTQETGPDIRLNPVINVFGGDCFKYMAVMGQSAPRVKGVADDPQNPEDLQDGYNADVNIRDLWVKQHIDKKWKALAFHQYTTGPAFIRTRWNTDAQRYGQTTEPKLEIQPGDDGAPMPVETGTETYANGDAEVEIHSIMEVSVPYEAKELRGNPLRLELMVSKWALLDKYKGENGQPGPLDKYRDGEVPDDEFTASSATAAEAREAVSNPSGTGRIKKPNYWRTNEHWIPVHLYQAVSDPEWRQIFQRQFPDGLYIGKVGNITAEVDNRNVTEEWTACRIGHGEKINERPVSADGLPIQKVIDDLMGLAVETVLRAITITFADAQIVDRESLNTNEAVPGEFVLVANAPGFDMSKGFYQPQPARLGDQVLPLLNLLRSLMQDITGIRPELSGGGEPTQTYREAKQRRDQALLQLAPQAAEMRFASEKMAENLVKLRAKYGSGTVKATRKSAYGMQTDVADMAQLKDSGWHAEADDNFPMTLADRRDAVFSMLKDFPPEVQQALSVLDPLNIEQVFELLEIPGFESAIKDQKEKTLKVIPQLLEEQPQSGAPNPDGTPGQQQPSLPPDPFDNHMIVASVLQKWLIANMQLAVSNPGGFSNVVARYQAETALATPPPPPPPPPIKGSLALSAKMEDFPNLVQEVLQGAGLPAPPPAATQPMAPPTGAPDLGAPAPVGPSPVQQASPIPPLNSPPSSPPPAPSGPIQ